ncbi:MAG: LacI family DNA-binding transcriptional regulator [Jatrophihabitantaceae bacterium]
MTTEDSIADAVGRASTGSVVPRPTAKLTIRDVAQAAGVSAATVSRALRGFDNVDERTRDRILAVAKTLHYSVSPVASRLASGRTGTIGIVTPYVGGWYFTEVFAGIEEGLKRHDMDLLLHTTEDLETLGLPGAAERMRRRVDGALVIGMSLPRHEIEALADLQMPVVLLGAIGHGLPSVAIDDRLGARKAVQHLVDLGHTRIGLVTGRELPTQILPENDRLEGYLDVLTEHGLSASASLRAVGGFTAAGGERAMTRLLARTPRPTAVFCMSDEMAYGAMRALGRAGLHAGSDRERGDIAIIGFDGHDLADAFDLSTIEQPIRILGRSALELLMTAVGAESPEVKGESLVLPTELRVRGSTSS